MVSSRLKNYVCSMWQTETKSILNLKNIFNLIFFKIDGKSFTASTISFLWIPCSFNVMKFCKSNVCSIEHKNLYESKLENCLCEKKIHEPDQKTKNWGICWWDVIL